jgi:hypothetical protein
MAAGYVHVPCQQQIARLHAKYIMIRPLLFLGVF